MTKSKKALKNKVPGAFIMCDMDGLKYINDNFSHLVGDNIIRGVGEQLKNAMPEEALIAHISGDEFCVFIPELITHDRITQYCKKFQNDIHKKVLLPDLSRPVTASIGVALTPEAATTYEKLSSKADHALLYVKNHGRNGLKFHAQRDDREQLLKGRQECTNIALPLMLKHRDNEEVQTWLKFGEFRIVFINYEKYGSDQLHANLCQINILDKANPNNPDSKKINTINEKITTFIKEAEYAGIFSWYSINQLLILSLNSDTIPVGVEHLKKELEPEMKILDIDIELKFNK